MDYYEKKRLHAKKVVSYAGARSMVVPIAIGVIAAVVYWVCLLGIGVDKGFAAKLGAAAFGAFALLSVVNFLLKRGRFEKMKASVGVCSDEELVEALVSGSKLADTVYVVGDKLLNLATKRAYSFGDIEDLRPYSTTLVMKRSSCKVYFIKAKLRNGSSDRLMFRTSKLLRDSAMERISERMNENVDPDYTSIVD